MNTAKQQADESPQQSMALVIFGLTGDLGGKKLFPALYELAAAGRLDIPVIGVGRSEHSNDEIREMFRSALDDHEPADGSDVDTAVIDSIDLTYLAADSTKSSTFDTVAEQIGDAVAPLVYGALPPDIFGDVASAMAASSFPDDARLMLEKPFGEDADSARQLWADITDNLPAERVFVVDHFLAKSAIENMAVVRHANALLANSLDRHHVESIDIEMSEAGSVDGRGSFYEGVGAIDDVVQSHLLQTMAYLMMEAPDSSATADVRRARTDLLASISPVDLDTVVLGQYEGYRDHDGVADDSTVETYVSMTLNVDNDRWRGVPVAIRTGKQLADSTTAATFHLRDSAPGTGAGSVANRVRFEIKPTPALALDLGVLDATSHEPRPTTVYACGPEDHGPLGDYATMFDNARRGDHRHFAHIDSIVEAWRVLAPLGDHDLELVSYEPGSNGPTR